MLRGLPFTAGSSGAGAGVVAFSALSNLTGDPQHATITLSSANQTSVDIPIVEDPNAQPNSETDGRTVFSDVLLPATGPRSAAPKASQHSINSPSNPATRGSLVAMFAAGGGQTTPPGVDGSVSTAAGSNSDLPVQVQVGGINAEVSYAGAAPGFVPGALQVNFRIPANPPTGDVPVVLMVATAVSQPGLTISLH